MHDRIKELAVQSGLIYEDEDGRLCNDIEKFAELIVKECIAVCNSRVGNSDYNTGRMHCVSDIKDHFGIK